jgi:acyl dehydratase
MLPRLIISPARNQGLRSAGGRSPRLFPIATMKMLAPLRLGVRLRTDGMKKPVTDMAKLTYEDFQSGQVFPLGPKHVTAEEIIEFAREFDPQPMHLDEAAGRASILGGLAASGWHTSAMFMRMMTDSYLLDTESEGAPGIDFMDWKKPVLAGDTLSGRSIVLESRAMRSRPGIGIVKFRHEVENQRGELVCLGENSTMIRMRMPMEASA